MNSRDTTELRLYPGEDAHRHPDHHGEDGGGEGELECRRQPLGDQAGDRLGQPIADAEIAVQHRPDVTSVADDERLVEAKLMDQRHPLRLREVLPQHGRHRVAHEHEQQEGDQRDHQQHGNRLQQAG